MVARIRADRSTVHCLVMSSVHYSGASDDAVFSITGHEMVLVDWFRLKFLRSQSELFLLLQ